MPTGVASVVGSGSQLIGHARLPSLRVRVVPTQRTVDGHDVLVERKVGIE